MSKKDVRTPPWRAVEPQREGAVDAHLELALQELRIRNERLALKRAFIHQVLVQPRAFWEQKVRRGKPAPEKERKETICWSPKNELRELQETFARTLFEGFGMAVFPATAYGEGCSIQRNAKFHRDSQSCIRIDLKNAFPSVRAKRIAGFLEAHGCGVHLAWVASRVLTVKGRLEQGAPVASHLFNIILRQMDEEIMRELGAPLVYTRYADDLVISSPEKTLPPHVEPTLRHVVTRHGFHINEKKTRILSEGHVDVPGIFIKKGRIRPNGNYVQRMILTYSILSYAQKQGHRLYVKSFGKAGRLKVFGTATVHIAPRRPDPYGTRDRRCRKRRRQRSS